MSTTHTTISAEVVAVEPVVLEARPVEAVQSATTTRPANNLLDKACLISVTRKWPKFSMKVPIEHIQVTAEVTAAAPANRKELDKRRLHSSKDLYDCQQLKDLASYDMQIEAFIARCTLPFKALKKGIYLLPITLVDEVENRLGEHIEGRVAYIQAAVNAFDAAKEAAKTFLGPLYNEEDYPTKEEFAASFEFTWQYLEIGVSEALRRVNADIARREGAKIQQQWVEAGEAAQKLLRANMNEFVSHLVTQLSPGIDGKRKRFYDSSLANLQEFMANFDARNLTEDAELQALVNKAKLLTSNISPSLLRNDDATRNTIQQGFEEIKAELSKLIEVAPDRELRLED